MASELKSHLRIVQTDTGQELELQRYISAAREQFELRTDMALMRQTWVLELPALPTAIQLPHPPLVSVDTVEYYDDADTLQAVDPAVYQVYINGYPGILSRKLDQQWPTDLSTSALYPWKITYSCGWATQQDVPQEIRHAILSLAGQFYEHRTAVEAGTLMDVPHSFEAVVAQYIVFAPDEIV